jgi:hypothetical protein
MRIITTHERESFQCVAAVEVFEECLDRHQCPSEYWYADPGEIMKIADRQR